MMMLRRWAVREHFVTGAYLWVLVRLSSNFTHNTSRGSSCAFGLYELWPTFGSELWPIWTFWLTLRFQSRSWKVLCRLQSYCTYMFSKVPSCAFSDFWTLTLKLTQHFDQIYDIGKSDWNILRDIMKTAQDSYTKFKMAAYRPLFTLTGLLLGKPS